MRTIRYRTFKRHLEFFLDKVVTDHCPVIVAMDNGRDVVVLSKTDYENMLGKFCPSSINYSFDSES